jgi:isopenicillin-N N-acyltransferase-like protein
MQYASGSRPVAECTSIGATPDVTESGHTLLGQNWDYKPHARNNCVIIEELQEPNKPNIVMHTEAGILGQKGLNSAGIGVSVNALTSDQDKLKPKVPFWVMVRGALNKRSLDQALLAVTSAERAVSGNLMFAQEGGEVIDLELIPDDFGFIFPVDGLISHGNNFVDPHCMSRVVDKVKAVEPGSLIRTNRSCRLLRRQSGKITIRDFQEVLKDHFGYPNSICAHPDPNYNFDYQGETIASVIFDLEERSITITCGQPCCNPYNTIRFESLRRVSRNGPSN